MDTYEKEVLTQVYGEDYVNFLENVENKIEEATLTAEKVFKDYKNAKTMEDRKYLENIILGIMNSLKKLSKGLKELNEEIVI